MAVASATSQPWNAILDVSLVNFLGWLDGRHPFPPVRRVFEVDLGDVAGVPFGFTDAAVSDDGRIAFVACAEDTEDAIDDGPVLGCRFGWLDVENQTVVVTPVVDAGGQPTHLKLEGIETRVGNGTVFDVVADMDRGDEPAQIAELSSASETPAPSPTSAWERVGVRALTPSPASGRGLG